MNTDLLIRKFNAATTTEVRHSTAVDSFCPFTVLPKGSRGNVVLLVLTDEELARLREPEAPIVEDQGGDEPFALATWPLLA